MGIKKILVTGSGGYIGAVLTSMLQKEGFEVEGIDTLYYQSAILGNYKPSYKLVKGDVRKLKHISLSGYDAIIHLAALSNDPLGALSEDVTYEINFKSSVDLAKKAKEEGVKRFLFSSSCSIYGLAKNGVVNETSPVNPLTAYAKYKIKTEKKLKKLADDGFCVGLMRNSTVFGYSPSFRDDLVVNNLTCCALTTNRIQILSDGSPWRPLIDVRDLSKIFIEFLRADQKKINAEIINIGFNSSNYQVKDLGAIIQKKVPSSTINFTGEHGSDSRSYKVNFSLFNSLFPHIKQEWDIEKSVNDLLKNLRASGYDKKAFLAKKFNRLALLNDLINKGNLDTKLYWRNL